MDDVAKTVKTSHRIRRDFRIVNGADGDKPGDSLLLVTQDDDGGWSATLGNDSGDMLCGDGKTEAEAVRVIAREAEDLARIIRAIVQDIEGEDDA